MHNTSVFRSYEETSLKRPKGRQAEKLSRHQWEIKWEMSSLEKLLFGNYKYHNHSGGHGKLLVHWFRPIRVRPNWRHQSFPNQRISKVISELLGLISLPPFHCFLFLLPLVLSTCTEARLPFFKKNSDQKRLIT